jgi:hypothetical protein
MERGGPAVCNVSFNREGTDEMIKTSIDLEDLRRRIYVKAKAETSCRKRQGFGWTRWSRQWLYDTLKLFNGYKVKWLQRKVAPAG